VNDSRGLAPLGYHIPTDTEWTTLTTFLGGVGVAGGKMKATGTSVWISPNTDATNSSGFTGLPAGYRYDDPGVGWIDPGVFGFIGYVGNWWSSSELNTDTAGAWFRSISYNTGGAVRSAYNKSDGFSVRCLRD
jgi:uncharacterized protein (TIGR02145 family)